MTQISMHKLSFYFFTKHLVLIALSLNTDRNTVCGLKLRKHSKATVDIQTNFNNCGVANISFSKNLHTPEVHSQG